MVWWVNLDPGPAVDTVAEDMKAFGAQDFQPPEWMREEAEQGGSFAVLPENWDAVQAFIACATQWHCGPKGEPRGLRYAALELVLKRLRIEDPDDAWMRVRVMEQAALLEFRRVAAD